MSSVEGMCWVETAGSRGSGGSMQPSRTEPKARALTGCAQAATVGAQDSASFPLNEQREIPSLAGWVVRPIQRRKNSLTLYLADVGKDPGGS